MNSIDISVIMLTYNREMYVERAIKSVLSQTFRNFEFIIVDNGSTDLSGAIADKYAQKDSRIHVIHKPLGNIGSGRNVGLDNSTGKFVTFIDDDDYAEPDFLEFLYNLAINHNADIAVCGSNIEFNDNVFANGAYVYEEICIMNNLQATECYLRRIRYNAAMPTKLVKRHLFNKIRFPNNGSYDDITTTYKYFVNTKLVVVHGVAKYTFYRHSGNNSSAATNHHLLNTAQLMEYLAAFRERTEYISKYIPELAELAIYSEWSYMISMIEKISKFKLESCNEVKEKMCGELHRNRDIFVNGLYIQKFEKEWMEKYVKNK